MVVHCSEVFWYHIIISDLGYLLQLAKKLKELLKLLLRITWHIYKTWRINLIYKARSILLIMILPIPWPNKEHGGLKIYTNGKECHTMVNLHCSIGLKSLPDYQKLWFSIRGDITPQGIFGNVWSHFWLSQLWGYYHLEGRGQGCCQTLYNTQDNPPQLRTICPKMLTVLRLRNPALKVNWIFMIASVIPSRAS